MKRGLWVAYAVLLLGAVWLALTMSGALVGWAQRLAGRMPPLVTLIATLAIPVLAALCSLRLRIDWRVRIALLLVLLACVPLLPLAFNSHPVVVILVTITFIVEEFGIIPFINRRRRVGT
jgi:cytochrome bd-type quinol oxidase subunit 2